MTSSEQREITVDGTSVSSVIEPSSERELCEAVHNLNQSVGHALLIGSGTRLQFGNIGGPFDRAISTARLNSVIEYSPDDLTIAVQAGATLASINEVLATSRQMLVVDAPCPHSATVGGSFATGLDGPSRLGFGSLKDAVIGIEAMLASGKQIKSGGMVVKNVTGYDMSGVFHGSLGAFGIVTRLNLKVAPVPETASKYVYTFERHSEAMEAAISCLLSGLEISALFVEGSFAGNHRLHLVLSGIETAVNRIGTRLSEGIYEVSTPVDASMDSLSIGSDDTFGSFVDINSGASIARVTCPASKQKLFLESLAASEEAGVWDYLADPGSGLIYLRTNGTAVGLTVFDGIRNQLTWLALPPELKSALDVFGLMPERNFDIVRRLKDEFDPDGRFNRGRFVGGL